MIVLGIDPGASGGIAWIAAWGLGETEASARGMPETERDAWALVEQIRDDARERFSLGARAIIERVHSMPKQGVASSFKFGQSYGFLRGCLIASGIPFEEVTPQRWQKAMGVQPRRKDESKVAFKNRLKAKAQQLFPSLKITHATADALLLAEYGRRLLASRNPTTTIAP